MDDLIGIVNLILALLCASESLLIFGILKNKDFRQNVRKKPVSIMKLIGAWRKIVLAIVFYCLIQANHLLAEYTSKTIPLLFQLLNMLFLFLLLMGLSEYYKSLKAVREAILEK